MTRPTIAKIEGPKSSIRRRIREGESGGPLSGDKEGGAGGRATGDGDNSSPLSAVADFRRMSDGGGGRSSVIGRSDGVSYANANMPQNIRLKGRNVTARTFWTCAVVRQ